MRFIILFLINFSIVLTNSTPYGSDTNKQKEPEYIPIYDFEVNVLGGDSISTLKLSDLNGKVVLLNFWATWCGPCIVEIPEFNDLYAKYKDRGFDILGVSVSDSKEQLDKFQKKFDVDYKILYASPDIMNEVNMNYGVNSVPLSYLINRDGYVVRGYPSAIIGEYDSCDICNGDGTSCLEEIFSLKIRIKFHT